MDFSFLLSISDGDKEFMASFIATFEDTTLSQIKKMQEAFNDKDFESLKKIAHQVKPTSQMLGFETQALVVLINDDPTSATTAQLASITAEGESVLQSLKEKFL